MYPTTVFNWIDQSGLNLPQEVPVLDSSACIFCVSSFDKGPEKLMEVSGSEFDSLFGTVEFSKHGQAGIQTKRIIDAGGRVLVKRVVDDEADLAFIVLTANLTKTTESGVTTVKVKWTPETRTGCKTLKDVEQFAQDLFNESEGKYPMYIFTDNGRGVSSKAVRFTPDYNTSKSYGTTFYSLKVYEGTSVLESQMVSFDPNVVLNDTAYGVNLGITKQVDCKAVTGDSWVESGSPVIIDDAYNAYIAKVSEYMGMSADLLKTYDLIFGYDYAGNPIETTTAKFKLDDESIDLDSIYGVALKSGSNGRFGDKPIESEQWAQAVEDVFRGLGDGLDEVWDKDEHKVGAVFDANYPDNVKEAIAAFVTFREDCVFFRDLNTGNYTFNAIKERFDAQATKNKFISDWLTSYTVKDPKTAQNIEVTMMYDFAPIVTAKFAGGIHTPLAGTRNGCVLPSAIKGTVNFTPVVTPTANQKSALDDMHLNYAIFQGDRCVVQSCYSSQDKQTELSWINNVLAVQEVMRAIRTACPQNRYRFVTNTDFAVYEEDVNKVLANYKDHFNILNFIYTQDKLLSAQKIFYGALEFAFGQWAQTEKFDMFILNSGNL